MTVPEARLFSSRAKYVLAVASEVASPLLRAGVAVAQLGSPTAPASWRRGLILSHTHIGDVLYRTCSLDALTAGLPECSWDFLTSPGTAEVLAGNPSIADVVPLQESEDSWGLRADAVRELAARGYDVVLCTNTVRHYADFVTALRLRAPNRIGIAGKGLTSVLSLAVETPMPQPYPAYFREMVAAVTGVAPSWELRPRIFPDARDSGAAADAWNALALNAAVPVVACTLTTRQPHGEWPSDLFVEALEIAAAGRPLQIVFCGSGDDAPKLNAAAARCAVPAGVLAGTLRVRAFAAFLRRCAALLAMDSGPRHIANAVGTPVVFARNLSYSRAEAGAYCATEVDIAPPDERVPPARLGPVLARVGPRDVADALLRVLAGHHQKLGKQ